MKRYPRAALLAAVLALPAWADAPRCQAAFDAGDAKAAITACTAALEANPEDAQSWSLRGVAHGSLGNTDQAAADLDRALGIDAQHVIALTNRAMLRLADDDGAGAMADLELALSAQPKNVELLLMAGEVAGKLGRQAAAEAYLERAAKTDPSRAEPWLTLAELSHDRDAAQTERYLDRAVKADKKNPVARHYRGHWRERQQKLSKAEEDYRAAAEHAPEEWHLYVDLARVLEAQKDLRGALKALDQGAAIEANPELLGPRLYLRAELGNAVGALADLATLQELVADTEALAQVQAVTEAAVDRLYAPSRPATIKGLAEVAVADLACQLPLATDLRPREVLAALVETRGDVRRAEAVYAAERGREFEQCLTAAQPPATTAYAAVRRQIGITLPEVEAGMSRLLADCSTYPEAQSLCAELAARYRTEAAGLLAQLRASEEKASARRLEVTRLKAEAPARVAELAALAVQQFADAAQAQFDAAVPLDTLERAVASASASMPPNVGAECPAPEIESAYSETPPSVINERGARYFSCLGELEQQLRLQHADFAWSAQLLVEARARLDALTPFRCSRRSTAQCINDSDWNRGNALVPSALVSQAQAGLAMYERMLGDGIDALRRSYNAEIAARNREIDEINAEQERAERARVFAEGLQGFADALREERGNGGYSGGYYDSSTSAGGIR